MDPQVPITPENTPPIVQPVIPEASKTTKDTNTITVVSTAIFVLLSLGAVAFLYYQNQQLKSMLASYQTPIVSPTPVATTDPTANWKTYTNTKYGFTFKYPDWPNGIEIVEKGNTIQFYSLTKDRSTTKDFPGLTVYVFSNNSLNIGEDWISKNDLYLVLKDPLYSDLQWIKDGFWYISTKPIGIANFEYYAYTFNKKQVIRINNPTNEELRQILSTFQFLEVPNASPKSTSTPVPEDTPTYY